jgi:hypothetical protein
VPKLLLLLLLLPLVRLASPDLCLAVQAAAAVLVGPWVTTPAGAELFLHLLLLLQVSDMQAQFGGAPEGQAAAALLLAYPGQLRRLSEVQLEGRLRDRRRGRTRSVAFAWVFGRDVLLV